MLSSLLNSTVPEVSNTIYSITTNIRSTGGEYKDRHWIGKIKYELQLMKLT
jgi:hypothetical protein